MKNKFLAGQILDVFSADEINSIYNVFQKLPDAKNTGKFKAYTNGFCPTDLVYPFFKKVILTKLEKHLNKKINLTHGMLLKESIPWNIHTDYVKSDNTPDLGILIPLNSELLNTHTVLFNELCVDNFDNFIKTHNKIKNNASNLHDNLMSHETVDRLEYVSLLGAYKWVPGSVIYWDRKLLHSSDNFPANNIPSKTALVLFTNNDI